METLTSEQTKERHRILKYTTSAQSIGDKVGSLTSGTKKPLTVSSPPEFHGPTDLWTPEDMFVGALEMCHMLTFMALARRRHVNVLSYTSRAEGVLEFVNGTYQFTRVLITPTIIVGDVAEVGRIRDLLDDTRRLCIVENSVSASVESNPVILVQ